jgi:hypothetical protein
MVAAIGNGAVFSKDAASAPGWGWYPGISRQEAARSSVRYPSKAIATCGCCSSSRLGRADQPSWQPRQGLKQWITAAKKRLHHNVLAIALANKRARIAWAALNKDRDFECEKTEMAPGALGCWRRVLGSVKAWLAARRSGKPTTANLDPRMADPRSACGCGVQVLRRLPVTLEH